MSGRTIWLADDADWGLREWIVVLGMEFGADGPYVIKTLERAAKRQNNGGLVKTGYNAVAREAFVDVVTASHVVSRSVTLGLLVEFEEDNGLFKARISWWQADQERALAASRKARQRAEAPTEPEDSGSLSRSVTPGHAESQDVPLQDRTGQERTEEKEKALSAAPTRLGDAQLIFDAWIKSTGRTGQTVFSPERRKVIVNALKLYPLDDVLDAVDGWRFSPHHRGENDRHTTYNDLELLLKSSKQLEKFRDLKRTGGATPGLSDGSNGPDEYELAIERKMRGEA